MLETITFTLRIMKKRPLRSLLTILQLALGVWIVAVILSLNFQSTDALDGGAAIKDSIAELSVSKREETEWGTMVSSTNNLYFSDLDRLLQGEYIADAFIYQSRWEQDILVDNLAYRVSIVAEASPNFAEGIGLELVEGEFFTELDQAQKNNVVVISEIISKQLFPNQSPVGKHIYLGGYGEDLMGFTIVGVYKPPALTVSGFIPESYLIFPLSYWHPWTGIDGDGYEPVYNSIYIRTKPGEIYDGVSEAKVLLADRAIEDMSVEAEYLGETNRFFADQIKQISLFLGAFAFVAVLISALGILSIMLVSVLERTREIGLRQALGASRRVIILQVLNESLVFSLLGATVGLIAAYFSAETLISSLVQEVIYTSLTNVGGLHPKAALAAFVLAVLVGQLFGLYPAVQAARMAPVDALREN